MSFQNFEKTLWGGSPLLVRLRVKLYNNYCQKLFLQKLEETDITYQLKQHSKVTSKHFVGDIRVKIDLRHVHDYVYMYIKNLTKGRHGLGARTTMAE